MRLLSWCGQRPARQWAVGSTLVRLGFLAGVVTSGLGCGRSIEDGVKLAFSTKHSCPVDRITVTRRPDLTERTLRARRHMKASAVKEVPQAPPQLRAKLKEAQELRRKHLEEMNARPIDRKPPPEIAGDPARLALWNKQQAEEQARLDLRDQEHPFAVAEGCGEKELYECSASRKRPNHFSCSASSYSP
ncbi:MAG: hypothetical protein HY906_14145 [Deltaproteobacteria bacterium]|nr:hypothetical protein [Deltaproteobacteria bacterium]